MIFKEDRVGGRARVAVDDREIIGTLNMQHKETKQDS